MRIACFVSLFGLLVGCGEEGLDVAANEDNFCGEVAEVACHNLYQCCQEGEIEARLGVSEPRTELQCREDFTRKCERDFGFALTDSLKAGRVTLDPLALNECLNAIVAPADSCAAVVTDVPWEAACEDSAFLGTVATGGMCFFQHDCMGAPDNAYCAANQRCTQRPTAGFPCSFSNLCASAFYCNNGICAARLAAGAPCTDNTQCAEDLFCDLNASPMPICTAKGPAGTPCTSNQGCVSDRCIPGQCMGTTQSCFTDSQCFSRCADDGSICTTSASCALGTCSVSGISCSLATQCTGGTGDTCVFPVLCLPGDCVGDPPVCTAPLFSVDYCENTIEALPLL